MEVNFDSRQRKRFSFKPTHTIKPFKEQVIIKASLSLTASLYLLAKAR